MKNITRFAINSMIVLLTTTVLNFPRVKAQNPNGVVTIKAGGVLNISGGCYFITNTNLDNRGTLQNEGVLMLNGNSTQTFPGSGYISKMATLQINNSGTAVLLNNNIRIAKELKLMKGKFELGNHDVHILSDSLQTAAISEIATSAEVSYGNGRFVIERFINVGERGHGKSWQFLSVPANGQTIKDCWQESGNLTSGYGTQITHPNGTASGYDLSTSTTSIKKYVSATGNFDQGPDSTNMSIDNPNGYMLFVRGDRTVASYTGSTPTVLRIRGTIFKPTTPPSIISVDSAKYQSVGNPYASQIDFTQLTKTGGIDEKFYTWDPALSGIYSLGAYQTMSATNGWIPVPGGGNYNGVYKTIESGQAFFVYSTLGAGTIGFSEQAKKSGNNYVLRDSVTANRKFLRSSLLTSAKSLVDGNAVAFDDYLKNEVDSDDALKMPNSRENFGLLRDNKILSVEGRTTLVATDTIFYNIKGLSQQSYYIFIDPSNFETNHQAYFVDRYLQTYRPLSLIDTTFISFNITNDVMSSRQDRFMIVFQPQTVLPLQQINIQATVNTDNTTSVHWQNLEENNVKQYRIEKSDDARNFMSIGMVDARVNNNGYANYTHKNPDFFHSKLYYRVKIVSNDGTINYSETVALSPTKPKPQLSINPNPVENKNMHIVYNDQELGAYKLTLINNVGQKVWNSTATITSNSGTLEIMLPTSLPPASYKFILANVNGKSLSRAVIIL